MSDRRFLPSNDRVVLLGWEAEAPRQTVVEGAAHRVQRPVVDLCAEPGGARQSQLLYGAGVTVIEIADGAAFLQAEADGYVGYVAADVLDDPVTPTHFVSVPSTHLYPAPDFKRLEVMALPLGARLRIVGGSGRYYETSEGGFIFRDHVRPVNRPFVDPVTVAQMFFGVPYLWGGGTVWGIDCSGLVQAAFHACGLPCPRDSDQQEASLGEPVSDSARLARGDLVFWKGHVAIAVDPETILHANAGHMATRYERYDEAVARIAAQGDGPVTSRRRVTPPPG